MSLPVANGNLQAVNSLDASTRGQLTWSQSFHNYLWFCYLILHHLIHLPKRSQQDIFSSKAIYINLTVLTTFLTQFCDFYSQSDNFKGYELFEKFHEILRKMWPSKLTVILKYKFEQELDGHLTARKCYNSGMWHIKKVLAVIGAQQSYGSCTVHFLSMSSIIT